MPASRPLTKRYGERMFADDEATTRFVKSIAYVGAITTHYRTQLANFDRQTPWAFPCTAGETTAVIDYNGDVRACELREKFAALPDYDYDFRRALERRAERGGTRRHRRRKNLLVYARLLHTRLHAPFAPRPALRVAEELCDA
jgi:hypothetical protein